MTKMTTIPKYGKKSLLFSRTRCLMILKLGMDHWWLNAYKVCIDVSTSTCLTTMSNLVKIALCTYTRSRMSGERLQYPWRSGFLCKRPREVTLKEEKKQLSNSSKILSLWPSSVPVQLGLCQTWSETPMTVFFVVFFLFCFFVCFFFRTRFIFNDLSGVILIVFRCDWRSERKYYICHEGDLSIKI